MEQKRYIFIKEYTTQYGTIPEGSQIDYVRGTYYINGGMCTPSSNEMFGRIINDSNLKKEYLREVAIPYNKI